MPTIKGLRVDDPVTVTRSSPKKNLQGIVAYTGPVYFIDDHNKTKKKKNNHSESSSSSSSQPQHDDAWIGIRLTGPSVGQGKNNGTVQGRCYCSCPEQCGLFVRTSAVHQRHLTRLEALRLKRELLAPPPPPQQPQPETPVKTLVGPLTPRDGEKIHSSSTRRGSKDGVVQQQQQQQLSTFTNMHSNAVTPSPAAKSSTSSSEVNEHRLEALRLRREMLQERIATLKRDDDDDYNKEQERKAQALTPLTTATTTPSAAAATTAESVYAHFSPGTQNASSPNLANSARHTGSVRNEPDDRHHATLLAATNSNNDNSNQSVENHQALLETQQQQLHAQQEDLALLHEQLRHAQQEALAAQNRVFELQDQHEELKSALVQKNDALQYQLDQALRQLAQARSDELVEASGEHHGRRTGTSTVQQPEKLPDATTPRVKELQQQLFQSQQELRAAQGRVDELEQEQQLLLAAPSSHHPTDKQDGPQDPLDNEPLLLSRQGSLQICDLNNQLEESRRLVDHLKMQLSRQQLNLAVSQDFKFYCLPP